MSKSDRIRDLYPLLYAYGEKHKFLDASEAAETTVEGRIRSIWPFIVRRVLAFAETLKPRELANYDPEDVLAEIWIKIAEKDHQWTAERGKYITFAGVIIDHELHAIRDKSRTVHGPRNSSCRMKQYRDEEASGKISDRRAKTANDIRRTRDGTIDLSSFKDRTRGPDLNDQAFVLADERNLGPLEILSNRESYAQSSEAILSSLKKLSAFEALVLSRVAGLGGRRPESVWFIAWSTVRDVTEVRRAKDRAVGKIRKHLATIKHPAVAG